MLRFYKAKIAASKENILKKISRVEIIGQEDSLVDNRQRQIESQSYVRIVNTLSLCAQVAAFIINICANNIPNSSYRNDRFISVPGKYFSNPIVAETSFLVVGASAPLSLLLINSSGSFAKYLPPLLKWGVYLTLLPEILYVIMFNVPSIKSNECLLNIWMMLVVVSHSFPTLLFGSIICLLDLNRQIWSIRSYVLHSFAVTIAVCFTLLELTSLTRTDLGMYYIVIPWFCNLIVLSLSSFGLFSWVKSGGKFKGESTLAKHYSYVISLILGSLNIYYWGMTIAAAVGLSHPGCIRQGCARQGFLSAFIFANSTTAILFTVVLLILSKQVIDQQADVLEQVFEEHAEVFIKPMPLENWQHRRQAWGDVDNESGESSLPRQIIPRRTSRVEIFGEGEGKRDRDNIESEDMKTPDSPQGPPQGPLLLEHQLRPGHLAPAPPTPPDIDLENASSASSVSSLTMSNLETCSVGQNPPPSIIWFQ